MPVDPFAPFSLDPDVRLAERVAALEKRVEQLLRGTTQTVVFPDGSRVRVEVGLVAGGRYGIRVYDNAGALVHDFTTPA